MTRLILARHAAHDWIGRGFAGRMAGVALNAQGRQQAEQMATRLAGMGIAAIYSSPQQRTQETAAPVAHRLQLPMHIAPEFDEVDLGHWTGRTFEEVRRSDSALWCQWLQHRSLASAPGGERFAQVAQRAMAGVERLRHAHPRSTVLVLSHGDVIKSVLATCMRMSLDNVQSFDIDCASISIIEWAEDASRVTLVNQL